MKVSSGWIYKDHWVWVHKSKKVCFFIFSMFFLYWLYNIYNLFNLLLLFFWLRNCLFKPSLFLIIRHILMVQISLLLIIPLGNFRFVLLWIFFIVIFFEIVLIAAFNYFMKLLFKLGRNLLDVSNEGWSKHSGYLIKSAFSIFQSENRHTIIAISSINT